MRGRLFVISFVVVVTLYTRVIPDPLNATAAFIIAGIIPGTHIMLGVWPMVLFTLFIIYLIGKFVVHIKLKFLENTAQTITQERIKKEFEDSHKTESAKDNRVIAAPNIHTIV